MVFEDDLVTCSWGDEVLDFASFDSQSLQLCKVEDFVDLDSQHAARLDSSQHLEVFSVQQGLDTFGLVTIFGDGSSRMA